MQAVNQQTGQILQGKLKPNVSGHPSHSDDNQTRETQQTLYSQSPSISVLQQVVKKNIMTYRTNALAEKPVSSFNSTQSLGPLQSV